MADSEDEGVASSLGSGNNNDDNAQNDKVDEGGTEGNMGVAEEAVWERLTAEMLSTSRPSEVRAALEESVPDTKLGDGGRVRWLAMWALDWVKVRGGMPERGGRKRKANARSHREEVAKAVLLYIKCECCTFQMHVAMC